ncbi:hypothetical protein OC835_006684 [Tilletia horrida]|nr:hypothetical protein OC835_006684 [Tilletia horrida]KAK0562749.1 hypothetical protein OC844_002556 [Tilletia horrida]
MAANVGAGRTEPTPVLAASLPHPLSQYAESLHPIFENCGAMTNGLHRLGDVEARIEDTSQRSEKYLQNTYSRIRADLGDVVKRLREETSLHGARMKEESAMHEARVQTQLNAVLERVETALAGSEDYYRCNFTVLLDETKSCNNTIVQLVRSGQSTWMRMQAQLVAFNAWSVAWPEAMRVAGDDGNDDGERPDPPQYEFRAMRPVQPTAQPLQGHTTTGTQIVG